MGVARIPSGLGALLSINATLAGDLPMPTGELTGIEQHNALLAGDLPMPTGDLAAADRQNATLAGDLPMPTGDLEAARTTTGTGVFDLGIPYLSVPNGQVWDLGQPLLNGLVQQSTSGNGGVGLPIYWPPQAPPTAWTIRIVATLPKLTGKLRGSANVPAARAALAVRIQRPSHRLAGSSKQPTWVASMRHVLDHPRAQMRSRTDNSIPMAAILQREASLESTVIGAMLARSKKNRRKH